MTASLNSTFEKHFFVADSITELAGFFGFKNPPAIIENDLEQVRFIEDLNSRRLRDAQVLSLVAANVKPGRMLDIGTHLGRSAARMAANSPASTVYTVNIHPDDLSDVGQLITERLSVEQIGSFYRGMGLKNIVQIYANTKNWAIPPEISGLSLVYVDGCHDTEFVYSDTKLILDRLSKGGFILWHDCSPLYRKNFHWINEAMAGIERLLAEKLISGHIINVRNSWIGIWQKN